MDDNRDNGTPATPEPNPDPNPEKAETPRWYIDKNGNVKGIIFTFSSENYHLFTDEAVTDPAVLAALRKPAG